jgi:hypothetical protein
MESPVARTSLKPKKANPRTPQNRSTKPVHRDPKKPSRDALRSIDSPKPHGDKLLDVINPLRHVAKDLT